MSEFAAVPSVPPVSEIPAADSREVPSEAVNVMYLLSVRAETSVTPCPLFPLHGAQADNA